MKNTLIIIFLILYVISPIDLMPGIPIDDIIAVLVGVGNLD